MKTDKLAEQGKKEKRIKIFLGVLIICLLILSPMMYFVGKVHGRMQGMFMVMGITEESCEIVEGWEYRKYSCVYDGRINRSNVGYYEKWHNIVIITSEDERDLLNKINTLQFTGMWYDNMNDAEICYLESCSNSSVKLIGE